VAIFELILMDIQMPLVSGIEATEMIRQAELGTARRIPIVALTANAMKGDQAKYLAAGMDGYVSKRFEPNCCETRLRGWCELAQRHSQKKGQYQCAKNPKVWIARNY